MLCRRIYLNGVNFLVTSQKYRNIDNSNNTLKMQLHLRGSRNAMLGWYRSLPTSQIYCWIMRFINGVNLQQEFTDTWLLEDFIITSVIKHVRDQQLKQ
jgi:hypothetical protein